jgi:hypothetical protein
MVIESLGIWLRLLNYFTFSSPNVIYNFNTCEDISIRKKTSFGIHRPLICEYLVTGYAAVVMDFGVHKLNSASILLFILSKTEKFRVEKKLIWQRCGSVGYVYSLRKQIIINQERRDNLTVCKASTWIKMK